MAPGDYAALSGTLTFSAGTTSRTVAVALVGDAAVEPNETFTLGLSAPTNATLGDAAGLGTITNDDVAPPPAVVSTAFQVEAPGDDGNQSGTSVATSTSTTWVGTGGSATSSFTAYRFADVTIPRNATITSARLEVRSASNQKGAIAFQFGIEAAGNSAPILPSSPPSTRTLLAARVDHSSNTRWQADAAILFDEMAPILQQLVARADWTAGNALTLILKGSSTARKSKNVRAYEAGSALSPRLIVTYTVP